MLAHQAPPGALDRSITARDGGAGGKAARIGTVARVLAGTAAVAVLAGAAVLAAGCSRTPRDAAGPPVETATGADTARADKPHDSATFSPAAPAGHPVAATAVPAAGGDATRIAGDSKAAGYVGVILARQAVNVAAEADGRLASISVRVGDAVRRGQELAALSTEDLHNELTVVQATVSAARSEQRRAELELDKARDHRARRERHPELYSEEDLASARSAEKEAAAALDSARARVEEELGHLRQLQTRLQHAVLRAPIDGRVALRFLDAGALVHSGASVVRLISSNDFMLRFAVPPDQAPAIRKGDAIAVRLDSMALTIPGHVSQVTPRIDTASQMVFVEADLQVPPGWAGRMQDGLPGRVLPPG